MKGRMRVNEALLKIFEEFRISKIEYIKNIQNRIDKVEDIDYIYSIKDVIFDLEEKSGIIFRASYIKIIDIGDFELLLMLPNNISYTDCVEELREIAGNTLISKKSDLFSIDIDFFCHHHTSMITSLSNEGYYKLKK